MPDKLKPIHESIVDALYQAPRAYVSCLGYILLTTKMPKNHAQILEAWNTVSADLCFTNELRFVPECLMAQKAEAEAAAAAASDHKKEKVPVAA